MPKSKRTPRQNKTKRAQNSNNSLNNNLKETRVQEGIRKSRLSDESSISVKTIDRIEAGGTATRETLHALLNALNALKKKRATNYTIDEVFPNHTGGTAP